MRRDIVWERDLPPLLLRLGLAFIALALPLGLLPGRPYPLWWLALPLSLGAFSRAAAWLAMLGFATTAFGYLGDLPTFVAVFTLAGLARLVYVEGGGAWALDPVPSTSGWGGRALARLRASIAKQQAFHADYRAFAYRLPLAFILLTVGGLLLWRGVPLVQALGAAWVLGGLALALGFLTPWTALYCALAFPLAVPVTGQWFWAGLALCALALAFVEGDRVSVDRWLRARGGLFPAFRRDVVLERLR